MSPVQWILVIAGIVGPTVVSLVMFRRGLWKKFPCFFNYIILYVAMSSVGLAAFFYSCTLYNYASWVLGTLMIVMEFAVIYEILANTLKTYSALADLAKMLFRWAAVFLFFTALITALNTHGEEASKLLAALNVLKLCLRLMECGLLLFLLVIEARLGVSWRNHGVAIAAGLGVYASVDLAVSYLSAAPWISTRTLDVVDGTTFVGALAFWACALYLREPASKGVLDSPSGIIFRRWNEALAATSFVSQRSEVLTMPSVESFLPGVERAVERVMARKMTH